MNAEGADKVSRKFESLKLLVVWHLRPRENRVKAKLKKPASVTVQQTHHASCTSCWLVTGPSGHVQREVLSSCAGRWRSPEPSDGAQAPNRASGQLPGLGGSEIWTARATCKDKIGSDPRCPTSDVFPVSLHVDVESDHAWSASSRDCWTAGCSDGLRSQRRGSWVIRTLYPSLRARQTCWLEDEATEATTLRMPSDNAALLLDLHTSGS